MRWPLKFFSFEIFFIMSQIAENSVAAGISRFTSFGFVVGGLLMAAHGMIYSRKVIAQILDLSDRHVRRLTDDEVFEEHSPGHYKLLPVIQGYIKHLRTHIVDEDKASDYNLEKARLTRLKREDAELGLQLKRNELHRSEDVEFVMTNMLVAFRAKLETLPHKVLPLIVNVPDGAEKADAVSGILRAAMDEALGELSEYAPQLFDQENYVAEIEKGESEEVEVSEE